MAKSRTPVIVIIAVAAAVGCCLVSVLVTVALGLISPPLPANRERLDGFEGEALGTWRGTVGGFTGVELASTDLTERWPPGRAFELSLTREGYTFSSVERSGPDVQPFKRLYREQGVFAVKGLVLVLEPSSAELLERELGELRRVPTSPSTRRLRVTTLRAVESTTPAPDLLELVGPCPPTGAECTLELTLD